MTNYKFREHEFVCQLTDNFIWDDCLYWDFEKYMFDIFHNLKESDNINFKMQIILLLLKISNFNNKTEFAIRNNHFDISIVDKYARIERIRSLCESLFFCIEFDNNDYDYRICE